MDKTMRGYRQIPVWLKYLINAVLLCALLALFTVSASAAGTGDPCRDFEAYMPWTETNSLPKQGTYVLENGVVAMEGTSSELIDDPYVKKAFLGL